MVNVWSFSQFAGPRRPTALVVALLGMVAFTASVSAEEDADERASGWSGTARLGYLSTSGNSETDNLNARLTAEYASGAWLHRGIAAGVGAREDDRTTAEAYELGLRTTYDFNDFDFMFGRVNWRKDKFSGFDQQFSQSVGYGRRLINQPRQHLNVEVGVGARQARQRDGNRVNEAILRFGSDYEFRFNDVAAFNFDLSIESGADNTFTEAIGAFRTKLLGRLATVVSYTVRNNSEVPDGTTRTDTFTSIALEYTF